MSLPHHSRFRLQGRGRRPCAARARVRFALGHRLRERAAAVRIRPQRARAPISTTRWRSAACGSSPRGSARRRCCRPIRSSPRWSPPPAPGSRCSRRWRRTCCCTATLTSRCSRTRRQAGRAVRAAARADERGRRGRRLADRVRLQARRPHADDPAARTRTAGPTSSTSRASTRRTTTTAPAASPRPNRRWRSTTPPRRGTARCSKTPRGPRARWSTMPATAAVLSPTSSTGSRPSWPALMQARATPGGRCCSKAGSSGRRWR